MRTKFLPLLLLLNLSAFCQRNLSASLQGSANTYVYKLNLKEAQTLYNEGWQKRKGEAYLHTLVDSFQKEPPMLSQGNYLFVRAVESRLTFELKSIGDVHYKIINNHRDLVIALHTKEGKLITDAAVSINGKGLRYDAATQTYRREKYKKEGELKVIAANTVYVFSIKRDYYREQSFFQKLTQTVPFNYVVYPFKKLFDKKPRRYSNFFYSTTYEQSFKGFFVFNQPKYKPGDTVRFKAFVTTKTGKPFNNKLLLRLSESGFDVDTVIAVVAPYRPGGFEYGFVLSDSFDLKLDKEYLLTLEEQSSQHKMNKEFDEEIDKRESAAKRKVVMRGRFYFEEYELNAITLSVRSDKKEHRRGDEAAVFLKAADANDMAVMDGRVKLIVKPSFYHPKTFRAPKVFLPDTLWQHEQTLETIGETKINIPDSIFPQASFDYEVECIFLNTNNEMQTRTLYQSFRDERSRILFTQQRDSLRIDYLVNGKAAQTTATLYALTENDDTLVHQTVQLPLAVKLSPFAKKYEVETDSLDEDFSPETSGGLVTAVASRTKDSVYVQLVNPARLQVWYTLFAGNKVLLRGLGDSLTLAAKVQTPKNYFLSLQYVFNDRVYNEDFTVPYRDKILSLDVQQPITVYPGQKATITVAVKDALNKPVPDADVTAYAFTKKFNTTQTPNVPYFGKFYPGRKLYPTFRQEEPDVYRFGTGLIWERWAQEMHLDTIEYYKFLHPKDFYSNTEPAADSLTQFAPFVVKNGELQPVHHLYIDEVPVFFSAAQQVRRYSFALSPGKHSLRLRTHNSLIFLDSFNVAKGVKTFLSINADTANRFVRIQPMPDTLTAYEKSLWSRYMLLMQNNFGENYAYVNSGSQLFLLPPSYRTNASLIGPLPNSYASLVVKNGFAQSFEPEGGYLFFISQGLIKQKQLKNPYPFSTTLTAAPLHVNFRDYVLTEKEIDSLWQEFLDNRSASTDLFTNPTLNKSGNGALQIGITNDSANKNIFIRNIFLFRYDDPDFLRIYRGQARELGYVPPGRYRLLFLLKEDKYFIKDSIIIKKDGINYYETGTIKPKPKDSVSLRISEIVNQKEQSWSGYNADDFNGIKESFNQQYFDASLFTETISGVVKDEKGNPIVGASVFIKGTRTGAVTNGFGQFSLRAMSNSTLVVNYVGYASVEKKVLVGSNVAISLAPMKQSLQEVVVVGYGTAKRKDLTGSVSSVSADGLAGKVAGVMIRGTGTLSGNGTPLVIVDGLPFSGKLEDIDPALITNITTMKDAAATAIYGDRAANGVIIVTTKGATKNDATATENIPTANTLRHNFRDYAYWQPKLITDAEGKVSFTVIYPDDITAWRSFVIAVTGNKQSGFSEGVVKSFKAISGNLSAPQFVVAGDTFNVIGKSLNYLMDSIEARRQFSVNDKVVKEDLLRFRNSWIDSFAVTALTADSVKLKYTIRKSDGYFDGEERSIPVFRQGVLETSGTFAALRSDTSFTIQPLSDTGIVKLYAETSVIPALEKEIESIRVYEYLCNEQLASKLKALLVQKRIDSFYHRPFKGEKNIREIISKLSQSKSSAGLWGWWNNGDPLLWISQHVMEALVQANIQGYATPFNKQVLIDYLIFNFESYRSTEQLSALHLLQALGAKADYKRYTDSLQTRLPKMSLYEKLGLAEIKQKAGLEFSVDSLLRKQSRTMFGNIYWGEENYRFFDNAVQNTLAMYRILKRVGGHAEELEKMRGYFLERRKGGYWRNTYESSLILETILPDMLVNNSLPSTASLSLSGDAQQSINHFPFATEIKMTQPLTVRKEGSLPVYFTAYQQHWNTAPKKVESDFVVQSIFEKSGDAITQLKAGEPVLMKINVTVKADAAYVMIEALIPAGCSYKDKPQFYGNNEVHREYFKNKVSIFCSELKKGSYTFTVSLLPRYAGRYTLNPAKAELMYFPVFYGREALKKIAIE